MFKCYKPLTTRGRNWFSKPFQLWSIQDHTTNFLGIWNGPIQSKCACKIWPWLKMVAKIRWTLISSCWQARFLVNDKTEKHWGNIHALWTFLKLSKREIPASVFAACHLYFLTEVLVARETNFICSCSQKYITHCSDTRKCWQRPFDTPNVQKSRKVDKITEIEDLSILYAEEGLSLLDKNVTAVVKMGWPMSLFTQLHCRVYFSLKMRRIGDNETRHFRLEGLTILMQSFKILNRGSQIY